MAQFGALPSFPLQRKSTSSQANDLLLKCLSEDLQPASPSSRRRLVTTFQKATLEIARLPPLPGGSGGGNLQGRPEWHQPPPKPATCSPLPFLTTSNAHTGTLLLPRARWRIASARCGCQWSQRSGCITFFCLTVIIPAFSQLWGNSSCQNPQYRMPVTHECVLTGLWSLCLRSNKFFSPLAMPSQSKAS